MVTFNIKKDVSHSMYHAILVKKVSYSLIKNVPGSMLMVLLKLD
jgi:hypothetical protein